MVTYSTIAARILDRLWKGSTRSTELVKGVGFTESLVFQTLKEMEREEIIYKVDNKKKFVVYDLTEKGRKLVIEEISKDDRTTTVLVKEALKHEQPLELIAAAASEVVYRRLPEDLQRESAKPLLAEIMLEGVEQAQQKVIKTLKTLE